MTSLLDFENLNIIQRTGLLIIKLNRPKKKNALTRKMYETITQVLNEAAHNEQVVIAAITGTGEYFSSGNDLSSVADYNGPKASTEVVKNFVSAFINFPKMLVAVVNGPAIGIATTILGLCDVVYASEKARFYTPFTALGLCAEGCSTYTFPRIMGPAKAGSMLCLNYEMGVKEAYECGLVGHIFKNDELQTLLQKLEDASTLPVKSMMANKKLMRKWDQEALQKANELECEVLEERLTSEDCVNAVMKFMQKRSKL